MVKLATNPLQLTSTAHANTFQPWSSASAGRCAYHRFFLSNASSLASSHGTVSFPMKTRCQDLDHRTWSGLRLVAAISTGKVSLWFTSTYIWRRSLGQLLLQEQGVGDSFLASCAAAKHHSTWLWRHVYLSPGCVWVAGAAQCRQVGSSPNQRCKLVEESRTLYVAPMVKLSRMDSMLQSSLQVIFLLFTPSHFIQLPCLAWDTARAHLPASSWCHTSSITRSKCSTGVAFCHLGVVALSSFPSGSFFHGFLRYLLSIKSHYIFFCLLDFFLSIRPFRPSRRWWGLSRFGPPNLRLSCIHLPLNCRLWLDVVWAHVHWWSCVWMSFIWGSDTMCTVVSILPLDFNRLICPTSEELVVKEMCLVSSFRHFLTWWIWRCFSNIILF